MVLKVELDTKLSTKNVLNNKSRGYYMNPRDFCMKSFLMKSLYVIRLEHYCGNVFFSAVRKEDYYVA